MDEKQYNKAYYLKTKEKRREKVKCDCGAIICSEYLAKHKATKIHSRRLDTHKNEKEYE